MTPVTHLVAGARLPLGKKISRLTYEHEIYCNQGFIKSLGSITSFFEFALDNDYATSDEIEDIISILPLGGSDQFKACTTLISKVIGQLVDKKRNHKLLKRLPLDNLPNKKTGLAWYESSDAWEFDFSIYLDMLAEGALDFDPPEDGAYLLSTSYGLTVLDYDIIEMDLPEKVKRNIIQLIFFCSNISGHETTIDMMTNEYIEARVTGADEYFQEFQDEFDEEELEYINEAVADFKPAKDACIAMRNSLVNKVSTQAISSFRDEIASDNETPNWLLEATEVLIEGFCEGFELSDVAHEGSDYGYVLSRPISFGFPYESEVMTTIHTDIAEGEPANLLLNLNSNTSTLLTNIDLAENVLLYINEKLFSMNNNEVKNG